MGRIRNETRDEILRLFNQGHDAEYISDLTGVKVESVKNITGKGPVSSGQAEDEEEEVEEEESLDYYKVWMNFWKDKYLETHAELVELQAIQEE